MSDKSTQYIARNMKKARIRKGLTQTTVANLVKTSPNYYAKIERGEATPSLKTFEKIVKALKVKSSDILPF